MWKMSSDTVFMFLLLCGLRTYTVIPTYRNLYQSNESKKQTKYYCSYLFLITTQNHNSHKAKLIINETTKPGDSPLRF